MPNQNLFTAPLSALKQIGEQTSLAIQQVGAGFATAASQGLDALIAGVPPVPGVPGVPGAPARAPGVPQLLPANLQQALSQVENLLIPPGLPRPTQVMKGAVPTPTPPTPPTPPAEAPPAPPAVAARRRVAERRGL